VASQELDRSIGSRERVRDAVALGLLGLLSGTLVWLVITFVWESYIGVDWYLHLAGWNLSFTHLTLVPGILFGVTVCWYLWHRRLIRPWQIVAYIAAATISNFIATNFTVGMVDRIESPIVLGMAAGLMGAGCLTAMSLAVFTFVRRLLPCLLMVAAGTLLGGLLWPALEDSSQFGLGFLLLYAAWQSGYAAALGTALPPRYRR
jgi:hypothetical protein